MLRQEQQLKPYKKVKNFEDTPLFMQEEELIPLHHALAWSVVAHVLFLVIGPVFFVVLGWDMPFFNRPKMKQRDIEFVLVNQPEKDPINKDTPLRADRNTQAGGIHDPNKRISPPEPALPKSAPSQQNKEKKKVVKEKPQPKKVVQKPQPQPVVKQEVAKVEPVVEPKVEPKVEEPNVVKKAPVPPKPTITRSLPPSKSPNTMRIPTAPALDAPKIASAPTGPVTSSPSGNYKGGSSSAAPKPVIASGGAGSSSGVKSPSNRGSGRGSSYSPGGGNVGNPGPGNPSGAPGVDALKEVNFGPYMSDLQRRIKANWDPPRGDESKRVVLLFRIAKDGRLLSVKVVKSSGSQAADRAALAAVELTAPFRALPANYRGSDVDIQFTFDYNVFGINRY